MVAQETLHALCRWGDLADGIMIRRFEAGGIRNRAMLRRRLVEPIKRWRPHGVVVRLMRADYLKCVRDSLPGTPIVATLVSPPELVNTSVVADIREVITLAVNHFRRIGLPHVALFCCASPHAVPSRTAAFRAVVPNGLELVYERGDRPGGRNVVERWLRSLPKPVGVVTAESMASGFLMQRCQRIGLRVPDDVQIVGVDGADECRKHEPPLTSITLPVARIGEVAMETMMRHVRRARPTPSPMIAVSGSHLIVRGSSGSGTGAPPTVATALEHMHTHARKGIVVGRLAGLSGMGRATFYRHFTAATGSTPARHARQLRVKEACRMLRESPVTVTAIATACGFDSLVAFTRFFRRHTGETPTAYRKRMAAS